MPCANCGDIFYKKFDLDRHEKRLHKKTEIDTKKRLPYCPNKNREEYSRKHEAKVAKELIEKLDEKSSKTPGLKKKLLRCLLKNMMIYLKIY